MRPLCSSVHRWLCDWHLVVSALKLMTFHINCLFGKFCWYRMLVQYQTVVNPHTVRSFCCMSVTCFHVSATDYNRILFNQSFWYEILVPVLGRRTWVVCHRPNVAKRSIWHQYRKKEYWGPTDDRPTSHPPHWKISNGHISATGHLIHLMFCSRVGF